MDKTIIPTKQGYYVFNLNTREWHGPNQKTIATEFLRQFERATLWAVYRPDAKPVQVSV